MVLSTKLGLKTAQADITAAFVHADLKTGEDIYVQQPKGMERGTGLVLRLKKSVYGLKQAPKYFFTHLSKKMEIVVFVRSLASRYCLRGTPVCSLHLPTYQVPRASSIVRIGRYLKETINRGLILSPTDSPSIDCYPMPISLDCTATKTHRIHIVLKVVPVTSSWRLAALFSGYFGCNPKLLCLRWKQSTLP
jgi:hypothetical protein